MTSVGAGEYQKQASFFTCSSLFRLQGLSTLLTVNGHVSPATLLLAVDSVAGSIVICLCFDCIEPGPRCADSVACPSLATLLLQHAATTSSHQSRER
jgi:hypothetical protein